MDDEELAAIVFFLVLLFILISMLIKYFIAREFYKISCIKGFDNKKYLWITFFMTFVGGLMVAALPNNNCSGKKYIDSNLPDL